MPVETGRLLKSVALRYQLPHKNGSSLRNVARNHKNHSYGGIGAGFAGKSQVGEDEEPLALVEAVLFLSMQPLGSRKLAQLAGFADGTKARTLVRALNRRYDTQGSAFRVEEVGGGFQLYTRSKFAPWLRRLQATPEEVRLSGPALETLSVIAYRQPVLRAEIEAIRGVQSGEVLRQLIERDFVRIVGRSSELGRPFLYGTTKQFLQIFRLRHIDELPRIDNVPSGELVAGDPVHPPCSTDENLNSPQSYPEAVEEKDVKTLATNPVRSTFLTDENPAAPRMAVRNQVQPLMQCPGAAEPDDDEDEEDDDFDDFDEDDEFEDDKEESDDEELEDEWEEVGDEDEEEEEEDEDEDDDDWDDDDWDDEDWDDDDDEEDDDWDDDEEEEEEEEKEK
jgi:segregation and condensation protein B